MRTTIPFIFVAVFIIAVHYSCKITTPFSSDQYSVKPVEDTIMEVTVAVYGTETTARNLINQLATIAPCEVTWLNTDYVTESFSVRIKYTSINRLQRELLKEELERLHPQVLVTGILSNE